VAAIWDEQPVFCFTADVDWASDDALREAHALFDDYDLSVTYFLTHSSPYLSELLASGCIDAGLHPNFLPGSSHGDSLPEVIDYCIQLHPEAQCFRSHRYFDVTDVTHRFVELGLRYDSNVCTLLQQGIRPFLHESGLVRFPAFFEDGTYLFHQGDLDFGAVAESLFLKPGTKVVSLHPMHLVMNSPNLPYSRRVKDAVSRTTWNTLAEDDLRRLRYRGRGIRDFAEQLLAFVRDRGLPVFSLAELYAIETARTTSETPASQGPEIIDGEPPSDRGDATRLKPAA
jgi:hypothetical protein